MTTDLGIDHLVSPNSKKQRRQMQQLAAMQGATPAEIRRAGGRYDFNGFWGQPPPSAARREAAQKAAVRQQPAARYSPCPDCSTPVREVAGRYWDENDDEHKCSGPDEAHPRSAATRPLTLQEHARQAREAAAGLTYRECKPGRDAHKAAIRAGKSREEAHQASMAALHEVRRQKHMDTAGQQELPAIERESRSIEERLAEVDRLHDTGVLTDEECQAKRAEIISEL
jgi:hypothetical protein